MTRAELIKKLKQNEKPFGLLEKVEKKLLEESDHCEMFDGCDWEHVGKGHRASSQTYRISPDYTEQADEYEVCEVKWFDGYVGVAPGFNFNYNGSWRTLERALRFKFAGCQFRGQKNSEEWFMYLGGFIDSDGDVWIATDGDDDNKPATPARVRFLRGE